MMWSLQNQTPSLRLRRRGHSTRQIGGMSKGNVVTVSESFDTAMAAKLSEANKTALAACKREYHQINGESFRAVNLGDSRMICGVVLLLYAH
jgi:hypothetical protein